MLPNNKKGKSFVVIIIIVAVIALFLRVSIEKILFISILQNEAAAQATLKSIATALDSYARNNQGVYPKSLNTLSQSKPVYLDRDYIKESPLKGYIYNCIRMDEAGYNCHAFPSKCKLTGSLSFTVTTGNVFVSEDCSLKD